MNNTPFNQAFFNEIADDFDNHVRDSIPLFNELIQYIQHWVVKKSNVLSIVDICGSTGLMGAELCKQGFKGTYINIDGSPQMIAKCKQFEEKYSQIVPILGGYGASWIDESGVEIPEVRLKDIFASSLKHDLTLEILGFQFFTKERWQCIQDISNNSHSAIFVEKFETDRFEANEVLKDTLHKSKSFTEGQINLKKEQVLTPMGNYLYNQKDFEELLKANFTIVQKIYQSGNFAGYYCTNLLNEKEFNTSSSHLLNNIYNA